MDAQPPQDTELLFECMQTRRDLLLGLRMLTDSQAEAARSGEVDVTLGILARKEALLEELAQVRNRSMRFQDEDPEHRIWESPQRREACRALVTEGDQLLKETVKLEQATLDELSLRRDAVAAQLRNGTDSILARNAYSAGELLGQGSLDQGGL